MKEITIGKKALIKALIAVGAVNAGLYIMGAKEEIFAWETIAMSILAIFFATFVFEFLSSPRPSKSKAETRKESVFSLTFFFSMILVIAFFAFLTSNPKVQEFLEFNPAIDFLSTLLQIILVFEVPIFMTKLLKKTFYTKKKDVIKNCEKCNIEIREKKNQFGFDISETPERGRHQTICKDCLQKEWKKYIKKADVKFISTLPKERYNSYSFITFPNSNLWGIDKNYIPRLETLLINISSKCNQCDKKPITRLIQDLDYYNRLSYPEYVPPVKDLCMDHFLEVIIKSFDKNNTLLDEINIPYKENGIYMSGEY